MVSVDINFDKENGFSGLFGLLGKKNNSNINKNIKQLFKDLENPYLSSMNLEDLLSYVDGIDGCSDSLKNFLKSTEPAERNLSNFKSYLKETSDEATNFGARLSKVGSVFANIGLSLANAAITWAISAGIEQLYKAGQAMDELRQSSQEYGSQFSSIKTDLAEFQSQINENLDVINSPTSSIEQVTAARENLLNIQNQMIEAYGSEAAATYLSPCDISQNTIPMIINTAEMPQNALIDSPKILLDVVLYAYIEKINEIIPKNIKISPLFLRLILIFSCSVSIFVSLIGQPQLGQDAALSLISLPHSGHLIKLICNLLPFLILNN